MKQQQEVWIRKHLLESNVKQLSGRKKVKNELTQPPHHKFYKSMSLNNKA